MDPSALARWAYVVIVRGMMFGDVGPEAAPGACRPSPARRQSQGAEKLKKIWLFVAGAGLASMVFGVLYGEAFGPIGLVPVLWLEPLSSPIPLLADRPSSPSCPLWVPTSLGTINRVREGGWGYALYARSGVAGSLFVLWPSG